MLDEVTDPAEMWCIRDMLDCFLSRNSDENAKFAALVGEIEVRLDAED